MSLDIINWNEKLSSHSLLSYNNIMKNNSPILHIIHTTL